MFPPQKPNPRTVSVSKHNPRLRIRPSQWEKLIQFLDANIAPRPDNGDLSIAFLDDAGMARLHERFLGDPSPTDVLTFRGDASHGLAGEICVSADQAFKYCEQVPEMFPRELTLYVVHGYLHLSGWDDQTLDQKRRMRKAEDKVLHFIGKNDFWPEVCWKGAPST